MLMNYYNDCPYYNDETHRCEVEGVECEGTEACPLFDGNR